MKIQLEKKGEKRRKMLPFGLFSVGKASGYHGTGLSKQLNVFWNVVGERVRSCFETDSKKKGEAICHGKVFFKYPFVFAFLLNSSTPLRVNMVRPWTVSCVQLLDCLFAVFEPRTPPHASSLHSRFSFSVFLSLPKYLIFILLLQSVPNCFAPETKLCPIPLE